MWNIWMDGEIDRGIIISQLRQEHIKTCIFRFFWKKFRTYRYFASMSLPHDALWFNLFTDTLHGQRFSNFLCFPLCPLHGVPFWCLKICMISHKSLILGTLVSFVILHQYLAQYWWCEEFIKEVRNSKEKQHLKA